ncbi:hypothetical protein QR685DRAFT_451932 [Neurospora intermedia]|uniref:Uncharacterized protein n=1 Tax=Neurospora intermedia TaxID=5142 RepID=A0ABR3D0E9_NEUIN
MDTWDELIETRKVIFATQEMKEMQRTELDTEQTIATRALSHMPILQGRVYRSLKKNTPFYHPLMANMFRQVEECRRRLVLAGFIYEEPIPPWSQPVDEGDVPDTTQPANGLPLLPSRSPSTSRPNTPEVVEEDEWDDYNGYDSDDEEALHEDDLEDDLPSIEELGIW